MKFIAITLISCALLVGCATNDYDKYTSASVEMQLAKSRAEEARYKALETIAKTGNETAKVAAVMALQSGQNQASPQGIAQPKSNAEIALGWASVLVPAVAQMHSVANQTKLGMHSSDNATSLAKDTNKTNDRKTKTKQKRKRPVNCTFLYLLIGVWGKNFFIYTSYFENGDLTFMNWKVNGKF